MNIRSLYEYKNISSFALKTICFSLSVIAVSVIFPSSAFAADPGIREILINVIEKSETVPGVFSVFSYIFGLVLGALGVMKMYEYVNNPGQIQPLDPAKRFIAGGAFFALPHVLQAAYETIAKDLGKHAETGFNVTSPGEGDQGLDIIVIRFMEDIWGVAQWLISNFGMIAGIVLIMIAIMRQMGSMQDGAKAPGGVGTIITFLVGGVLFSLDGVMAAFGTTLFGDATAETKLNALFMAGDAAAQTHVNSVLSAVLAFIMVLGWVSFVRGFFILRAVAEGDQQASMMAALTHIFAGALAVQLGPFLNAVQSTLEIMEYGISFS